jgi:hypothetical protein
MCCFFAALLMFGPRLAILVWWVMDPVRWEAAFSSFFWPLLGFIFLPWTTLMYVVVAPGGVVGFDWIIIGLGVLADIASYSSSEYERRERYGATAY